MIAIFTAACTVYPATTAIENPSQALLRFDDRYAVCWLETLDEQPIAAGETGQVRVRAILGESYATRLIGNQIIEIYYGGPNSPWGNVRIDVVEKIIPDSDDP